MPNLILNPSFELDPALVNWTPGGTTTAITRSTVRVYDGTYACRIANPTLLYSGRTIESDKRPTIAGAVHTLSAWFYPHDVAGGSPVENMHVRMRMRFWDASFVHLGYGYWNPATPLEGYTQLNPYDTWHFKSFSFTSPAGTAWISVLFEFREVDPQPGGNFYLDLVTLEGPRYPITADDSRITGAIAGPFSPGYSRIRGLIAENVVEHYASLIKGEIVENVEWLEYPDDDFLAWEDRKCSKPKKRLLLFHDSFPDNPIPGPDGAVKYIDITDRVITYGRISRNLPTTAKEVSSLTISDLAVELRNDDFYFTTTNEASPYYGLGTYTGWRGGGHVELWAGFRHSVNTVKLIQVAKMVIVRIIADSSTAIATMDLRDYSAVVFDKVMGEPIADAPRPLEYPKYSFTAGVDDKLKIRTSATALTDISIGTGDYGKITRGLLMEEQLNLPYGSGGLVTVDEEFSVEFDEETQLYTFSVDGKSVTLTGLQIDTTGCAGAPKWGFAVGASYSSPDLEIVSPNSIAAENINFSVLLRALLEDDGGFDAADVDIESLAAVNFMNVSWEETSLAECIAAVVLAGSGLIWMTRKGQVYFRTFASIVSQFPLMATATRPKVLSRSTNYSAATLFQQDADTTIRKITLIGKFDSIVASVDSGLETGSEITLSSRIIDDQTVAENVVENLYTRYNVEPKQVVVVGEYLPSINPADTVEVEFRGVDSNILAQVVVNNLNVGEFSTNLTVQPFSYQEVWDTKAAWDDFDAEDVTTRLYVPHDENYLQMKLMESATGYRDYVFEYNPSNPSAQAKWLAFMSTPYLDHQKFFIDHFDVDPLTRYDVIAQEIQTGLTLGGPGPVSWDSVTHEVRISSMVDNYSTYIKLKDLLDEAVSPYAHYTDYRIASEFKQTDILGANIATMQVTSSQCYGAHYAHLIRMASINNFYFVLVRTPTGLASPGAGYVQGGSPAYLYNVTPANKLPFGEYIRLETAMTAGTLAALVEDYIAERSGAVPVPAAWNFPAQAAIGFSRSLGFVRKLELSSVNAPYAPDPVFEFATKATPAAAWSAFSTTFPESVVAKYIKIRVSMSRADKYMTVPILKKMAVSYLPV